MRYAIIGSGMMGQEHIRNIALLGDAEVSAVADPDEPMRAAAARLAGGARAFDDYRDLLAADVADALVVASPNHTHAAVLDDVLTTDLPVLVEKPLCTRAEDCDRIVRATSARTALVWVAMEYRYMPPIAELRAALDGGKAGALKMLSIREHRYPFLSKVGDWNRFARNSGGTLVEKCCHFFDLMRLITGAEPTRLYASGAQSVNHLDERYEGQTPDIVDNAMVVVDFDNGVRASLDLCMFAEGSYFQEHVAAVGDTGKIEVFIPGPPRFRDPASAGREAEIVISPRDREQPERRTIAVDPELMEAGDHHGSTFFQHRAFREAVLSGTPPAVSVSDGAMAVKMGLAAETSIRTGRVVGL